MEEHLGFMLEEEKESPVEELLRQIRHQVEVIHDEQVPEEYDPLQIHDQF